MKELVDDRRDDMKTREGIGLYKVSYEMDVADSKRDHVYVAGVLAYTNKEAIDSLVEFSRKRVKGFKGMKINEVAFEGGCHAISNRVRSAILKTAISEGIVVSKEEHQSALEEENVKKEPKKTVKKSIIPKETKE